MKPPLFIHLFYSRLRYFGRILSEDIIEVLEEMHPAFIQSQVTRIQQLIEENIDNEPVLKRLFDMFERANRATANFEKKKQDSRDPFCVLEAENMVQKGRSDVLDMVRLPDPPEEEEVLEDITCSICFDDVEGDKCIKLKSCGHQYCLDVITTAIINCLLYPSKNLMTHIIFARDYQICCLPF